MTLQIAFSKLSKNVLPRWPNTHKLISNIYQEIVSRIALFSFINVKALNLFWVMVERSQVFKRLIVENDLSGVADVAPIVKTNLIMMTTFLINLRFSFDNDCITSTTSLKLTGLNPRKMVGNNSNSHGKD